MVPWPSRRSEFRYPAGRLPRTAVLVDWFRENREVRAFPQGWCDQAQRFAPQAIAGTWPQFQDLMSNPSAAPQRAIVVLAQPGGALLDAHQREQLWQAFRVPVFEQIIGERGQLLAGECEAHQGLHVETAAFSPQEYPLDTSPCPCGRSTPRVVPSEPAQLMRAVATYAR